jgi:DNA-binding transcriptional MerR regulator
VSTSDSVATAPADQLTWTAGAVARMLGLPASTLRGWHRRYRLPLSRPQAGTHRRYTRSDIDALLRMKHLIDRGLSTESAARQAFHPARADTRVDDLLTAVTRLDTDTAVAVLDAQFAAHGVVATWTDLCCPALNALGGPAAPDSDRCIDLVHALSWAITAALHRLPAPTAPGAAVLLACVDGERHTLPLEALRAALAQRGTSARLLGASVPTRAVADAVARGRPAAVVLWNSTRPARAIDLTPLTGTVRLVLAGPAWDAAAPRGAAHPRTLAEAVESVTGGQRSSTA